MSFENFPYVNFHELNLDWIVKTFRHVADQLEAFDETNRQAIDNLLATSQEEQERVQNIADSAVDDVTEVKDDAIDQITGLITDFSVKHRVIFIADSYGGRVDALGRTLIQLVQANLISDPADFYGSYVPGAAFAHQTPAGKFITQLQNATISDPDTVSEIVVSCGANDANYTYADTITAISEFYTYAKTHYRRAKVIIVGAGLTFTPMGLYIKRRATEAFLAATEYGIVYPSGCEYVLMDSYLLESSDRCHPNANGVPVLARAIHEAISSGHCTTAHRKTFGDASEERFVAGATVTLTNPSTSLQTVDLVISNGRMSLLNGVFTMSMANNAPLLSSRFNLNNVTFTENQNVFVVEITNTLMPGVIDITGTVQSPVGLGFMVDLDDTTNMCACKMLFSYDEDANKYYLTYTPVGSFTLTQNRLAIYGSFTYHM